ncbi:MAG: hypothetical protein OEZ13_00850 [Spirochaetia bacterium]|nr:hypothetical protein [Spirochaetia bacterium]
MKNTLKNMTMYLGFVFLIFSAAACKDDGYSKLSEKDQEIINSRRDRIKPNLPYYSDRFIKNGMALEIGAEKNYEEVYRNYEFYEAKYDENKRVIEFKTYEKGEISFMERYFYDEKTQKLLKKEIYKPYVENKKPEVKIFN